jgi:ABC-2 type transport system permease protein
MASRVHEVVRKEALELLRDGRLLVVGGLAAMLVVAALVFGWRETQRTARERAAAQVAADTHWREQGDKNPHVAAHYGMWVFKPATAMAALDPGVTPHLGAALKLEAHRQNLAVAATAEDSVGLQRFGTLTPASVLQWLGPLLVAALGFALWSSERERGTLRLLRSAGVTTTVLLAGKSLALAAVVGLTLLPAVIGGAVVVSGLSAEAEAGLERLALLGGVYAIYFAAFMGITLGVSALAARSRDALLALVAIWGVVALVVPRVASEIAPLTVQVPSHQQFADAVAESLEKGLPGHGGREARIEALTQGLMGDQGFSDAHFLMDEALLTGIELRAEAAYEDEVFQHHVGALMDALAAEERAIQAMSWLSPVLAVRSLSMALSGTDFEHHRHFTVEADGYRRALVDMLDKNFAENAGTAGWDYVAGKALWDAAPRFSYSLPSAGHALGTQGHALAALAAWLLMGISLAVVAARRQSVLS